MENWFNAKPSTWASKVSPLLQKAQPAMKWASRAGTAVTAITSFVNQYQSDSRNPSMGEGEKIARATTQSAATTVGAYLGAKGGAALGASIGAVGGPVGIAVGGIVGGIVGGMIGSGVGSKIGDALNSGISSLWH
ncbi:hypothetical protein [Schaalia vaccimaxillae]|uniref:hypothetical protein n=1 Tax=Schaalia vaccimaxillae TaxID=183916 RepID=UPI0003B5C3B5|nr:hypothetical protein [Schaalia vaccimaxillae]